MGAGDVVGIIIEYILAFKFTLNLRAVYQASDSDTDFTYMVMTASFGRYFFISEMRVSSFSADSANGSAPTR